MATVYERFLTWVFGFKTPKSYYPEPWNTLNPSIFTDGRSLVLSTGVAMVGASIARLNEVFLHRGTFAIDHEANAVIADVYSKTSATHRVIRYKWDTPEISACSIRDEGDGTYKSVLPIEIDTRASGSGAPFFAVIFLGYLLKQHGGDVTAALEELHSLLNIDVGAAEKGDELQPFSEYNRVLYKTLKDVPVIGTGMDGVVSRLSLEDLEMMQTYKPFTLDDSELWANSLLWNTADAETVSLAEEAVESVDYVEEMKQLREELHLPIHVLSDDEKALVPELDPNYVPPAALVDAARRIRADWGHHIGLAPNIILEGDAGSGKTTGSIFWAYVFNIPRTKMTMSPTFESANLIGAFYPVFRDLDDWDIESQDKKVLKKVKSLMESDEYKGDVPRNRDLILSMRKAMANEEVRALIREEYNIPSEEEVLFDPEGVWRDLGHTTDCPTEEDVTFEVRNLFQDKVFRLMGILSDEAEKGHVSYQFIISELLKAFQNGWMVEIQEAASVLRPGVLTELNSLLEPNGSIELPNGQRIYRHPDTIVVITTNRGYAGNVDLNESLRDRCVMGIKMDTPSAEEMAARAMARTGLKNKAVALAAAKTMKSIEEEAKSKCIRGSYGMRSLLGWMMDLVRGDFSEETFMQRVIYKMTTDDDDVETLRACYRANCNFASSIKMGKTTRI